MDLLHLGRGFFAFKTATRRVLRQVEDFCGLGSGIMEKKMETII